MERIAVALLASLLLVVPESGAAPPAAIDAVSLMDLRFYEQRGAFMVDDLQLVFPQSAAGALRFVISSSGQEVASVALRTEAMGFDAFADINAQGPGILEVGKAGDYVMGVEVDGEMITSVPFSMKVDEGDDPFNPKKLYTREGPWSEFAYISQQTERPNDALEFNWWIRRGQVPGEKRPKCSIEVKRAGELVATSKADVVLSSDSWQLFHRRLVQPDSKKRNFTMAMLAAGNGKYTIAAKCAGKVARRYSLSVAGGKVVDIPRARLGHRPRHDFLSPRRIDTSSGSGSSYKMQNIYWATAGD